MKKYKSRGRNCSAIKFTGTANNFKELKKDGIPYRIWSDTAIVVNPHVQDLMVEVGQYIVLVGTEYRAENAERFEWDNKLET